MSNALAPDEIPVAQRKSGRAITRRIICTLLGWTLRIFFRRIEVIGADRVPEYGPVLFVLNHPNALVDPIFVLCLAPRRVSFLAKAPLFRMPVIGFLVRALDSLPVYRHQDAGADTARNRETFVRASQLLAGEGTIALFPEGVSHNEPQLQPLKTGAARIALSAASAIKGSTLKIVPAGLYYTAKTTFRSGALLYFGEPIEVERVALDGSGEPPREAVRALSERIEQRLRKVTLNAEHEAALKTIIRAEHIFSSAEHGSNGGQSLARELGLRQRFIAGYAVHRLRSPERLAALESRITRYEQQLRRANLDSGNLAAASYSPRTVASYLVPHLLFFVGLLPVAVVGWLMHYPAYRAAGFFATRFGRGSDDMLSTIKMLAAMLLFPATWIGIAVLFGVLADHPMSGIITLLIAPLSGYAALRFFEELDSFRDAARAFTFFVTRRRFFEHLLAERERIRGEILALGDEAANIVV
ncbi:MAG: 1-acyl-sn-glycerol-3-phosphate acyltransferase [Pyrinomonadaceae bacterium]|nr:1-acyl-sn-glycerol-3-phosphate acyltransferase [Pyrinomonadaceae bacterium]